MRKRLVIAAVCILALPLLFSTSQNEKVISSTASSAVALAGHGTMGGWCECGTPGCICDPGEEPIGSSSAVSDAPSEDGGVNQGSAPDADPASGFFVLALAILFLLRMR